MAKVLTDDSLTQEEAKIVARKAGARMRAASAAASEAEARAGNGVLDPTLGSASGMASRAVEQATAMARNIGDQASAAGDALYQQGTRAGEYVKRNVNQYPLAAVLAAGAIGFVAAYLFQASRKRST
jgi:hypothetical protein